MSTETSEQPQSDSTSSNQPMYTNQEESSGNTGDQEQYEQNSSSTAPNASEGNNAPPAEGVPPSDSVVTQSDERSVYIANLHESVTEEDLRNFFGTCGNIRRCTVIKNMRSGLSKGVAFIEFDDKSSAATAMTYKGRDLKGFPVNVLEKRTRSDKDVRYYRGSRGFRGGWASSRGMGMRGARGGFQRGIGGFNSRGRMAYNRGSRGLLHSYGSNASARGGYRGMASGSWGMQQQAQPQPYYDQPYSNGAYDGQHQDNSSYTQAYDIYSTGTYGGGAGYGNDFSSGGGFDMPSGGSNDMYSGSSDFNYSNVGKAPRARPPRTRFNPYQYQTSANNRVRGGAGGNQWQ